MYALVVLPDLQYFTNSDASACYLNTMMRWIYTNRKVYNIEVVLQPGDITNTNDKTEWRRAVKAFEYLQDVSYVVTSGNHDYDDDGKTLMGQYFSLPGQLHSFKHLDIITHRFNDVPPPVVARTDRQSIFLTHAYMYMDGSRYSYETDQGHKKKECPQAVGGQVDGKKLWEETISRQSINFVICGHTSPENLSQSVYHHQPILSHRLDITQTKTPCHQLVFNTQHRPPDEMKMLLIQFFPTHHNLQIIKATI